MSYRDTLTESELRSRCMPSNVQEVFVSNEVYVTQGAKEYLKSRSIALVIKEEKKAVYEKMTETPIASKGQYKYVDAETGQGYERKPEAMTHLRGNRLVMKTHPRIALRGKLDTLNARVLEVQILSEELLCEEVVKELGNISAFIGKIISAEVKEQPLGDWTLLGMQSEEIRYTSQFVKETMGIDHPVPCYSMGKLPVALNGLRTAVREVELCAVEALLDRQDIILALNRLSSGIYILFCRLLVDCHSKEG